MPAVPGCSNEDAPRAHSTLAQRRCAIQATFTRASLSALHESRSACHCGLGFLATWSPASASNLSVRELLVLTGMLAGAMTRPGASINQEDRMKLCHMIWRVVALSAVAATFLRVEPAQALAEGNPKNGLSSSAFLRNSLTTNKEALGYLITYSLHDLFSPTAGASNDQAKESAREFIRGSLHDPRARAVAEELVRCALNKSTELSYSYRQDPNSTLTKGTWNGELGLCQKWHMAPPDLACQQIVTSCLMARVNALNAAVPISMRGASPLPPPSDAVLTEMTIRESLAPQDLNKGEPIPAPGWSAAYVGTCTKGERVRLELPGSSAIGPSELRTCAGIHGCESGSTGSWSVSVVSKLRYQHIGDSSNANAANTVVAHEFSCPTDLPVAGYFSVMVKNGKTSEIKRIGTPKSYPAAEKTVFGFLEGAFFGNLFDPDGLDPQGTPDGLPYKHVYACYSAALKKGSEDRGVAYLNDRICAMSDEQTCFPNRPRPCDDVCEFDAKLGNFVKCETGDAPGESPQSYQPTTTYLNEPCDLITDTELCNKLRAPAPCRGCCCGRSRSCSAGGGALQMLPGVAVLGLLLRGRRRRRLFRAG